MKTIGVLVGRFQTHELTEAHEWLIDRVAEESDSMIVMLGEAPARLTESNMLPHFLRRPMIEEKVPYALVDYIMDMGNNDTWCKVLDKKIAKLIKQNGLTGEVVLYGGRDSFLPYYTGKFKTKSLEQDTSHLQSVSATEKRSNLFKSVFGGTYKITKDFLAGFMFAAHYKFPISYIAVDIAMYCKDNDGNVQILMGRKPAERFCRFPGGIVDPEDDDNAQGHLLELSAARELWEETGNMVDPKDLVYMGSWRTKDYRYLKGVDKLSTTLFAVDVTHKYGKDNYAIVGAGQPGDDLAETFWVDAHAIDINEITPGHRVLFQRLLTNIQ